VKEKEKEKEKLTLYFKISCYADTWDTGGTAPHIFNLSTRWRSVVSWLH